MCHPCMVFELFGLKMGTDVDHFCLKLGTVFKWREPQKHINVTKSENGYKKWGSLVLNRSGFGELGDTPQPKI